MVDHDDENDPADPGGENPYEAPDSPYGSDRGDGSEAVDALPWSPTEAIAFGWECIKSDPMIILVVFVAQLCMNALSSSGRVVGIILEASNDQDLAIVGALVRAVTALANVPISVYITLGLTRYILKAARGQPAEIGEIFTGGPFWSLLGATIIYGICVFCGCFFVIGIILGLGWMFFGFLIVDQGETAIESLARSWRMTTGHKWELFLFCLLCIGITILGLLACCIGAIFTSALLSMSTPYIYFSLIGEAPRTFEKA